MYKQLRRIATLKQTALVFPGQGAQVTIDADCSMSVPLKSNIGMGKELYKLKCAREVFDECEEVIPGLKKVMFEGPAVGID